MMYSKWLISKLVIDLERRQMESVLQVRTEQAVTHLDQTGVDL